VTATRHDDCVAPAPLPPAPASPPAGGDGDAQVPPDAVDVRDRARSDAPALVCKVCGERIESLTVADGREVLDLVRFQERHAKCLAASADHVTTRR